MMLVFAFQSEIWILQNFNFTVFEDFCLSLSWKYRFLQNVNHARVQSKTNKYCKFHVDLTRIRLSKNRFKKLGMVPKKLYRNTLISEAKGNSLLAVTCPIQSYLFAVNLEFWHLSPKFSKRPMTLHRNNRCIPKKSDICVFSLIKIPIFNVSITSNHPCDELFANANLWPLFIGRQYPVYGRCIWEITCEI